MSHDVVSAREGVNNAECYCSSKSRVAGQLVNKFHRGQRSALGDVLTGYSAKSRCGLSYGSRWSSGGGPRGCEDPRTFFGAAGALLVKGARAWPALTIRATSRARHGPSAPLPPEAHSVVHLPSISCTRICKGIWTHSDIHPTNLP